MFPELVNQPGTTDMVMIVGSVCTIAITATVWILSRFQTKAQARVVEERLATASMAIERRHSDEVKQLWINVNAMRDNMHKIGADVSYIRGRIEPHE